MVRASALHSCNHKSLIAMMVWSVNRVDKWWTLISTCCVFAMAGGAIGIKQAFSF